MKSVYRLAKLHLAFLILSVPLLMLLYVDPTEGDLSDTGGGWAYVSVTLLYGFIAVARLPKSLFDGLARMGVTEKAARYLVLAIALFSTSVVIGNFILVLMIVPLVAGSVLFVWAMMITLFRNPRTVTPDS